MPLCMNMYEWEVERVFRSIKCSFIYMDMDAFEFRFKSEFLVINLKHKM